MICFKVTTKGKIELDVAETDFDELKDFSFPLKRFNTYLKNTGNTRADNNRFAIEEMCMDTNFSLNRFVIADDGSGATFWIEKIRCSR